MKENHKKVIIVGAGVSGLTLAYLLSRDGHDVTVIEKEVEVGGLARSFSYDEYTFDIGPHRFHTDQPDVLRFIQETLDNEYCSIERKSGVRMFDQYFDWPLSVLSPLHMPLSVLWSVGRDFFRNAGSGGATFEDYIINAYGKTLYELFFRPYTEKFLKIPCSRVSRDWAVTGIDRAVIDKNLPMDDLAALARSILLPRSPLMFLYPKSGGIGVFSKNLAKKASNRGAALLLNTKVDKIFTEGNEVRDVSAGGREFECGLLVWTAPVTELLHLLGKEAPPLKYLSLILYNYRIDHAPLVDYQWCYFGSEDVPFNRVSIPSLFNPSLAPRGASGLCVEVTCAITDPLWKNPETSEPGILRALKAVGLLRDERAVLGVQRERIPNAYPIYSVGYEEKFRNAARMVEAFSNIRLLGRTGSFWYNNMDHSIKAAMDLQKDVQRYL